MARERGGREQQAVEPAKRMATPFRHPLYAWVQFPRAPLGGGQLGGRCGGDGEHADRTGSPRPRPHPAGRSRFRDIHLLQPAELAPDLAYARTGRLPNREEAPSQEESRP